MVARGTDPSLFLARTASASATGAIRRYDLHRSKRVFHLNPTLLIPVAQRLLKLHSRLIAALSFLMPLCSALRLPSVAPHLFYFNPMLTTALTEVFRYFETRVKQAKRPRTHSGHEPADVCVSLRAKVASTAVVCFKMLVWLTELKGWRVAKQASCMYAPVQLMLKSVCGLWIQALRSVDKEAAKRDLRSE